MTVKTFLLPASQVSIPPHIVQADYESTINTKNPKNPAGPRPILLNPLSLPPPKKKNSKKKKHNPPLKTETLEGVGVGFLDVLVHTASIGEYSVTIAAGELLAEV